MNKIHLRDGEEKFDEEEVKTIENWSTFEHEKKIAKLLRDFGTMEWLRQKEAGAKWEK